MIVQVMNHIYVPIMIYCLRPFVVVYKFCCNVYVDE